jgi:hypothetical protein
MLYPLLCEHVCVLDAARRLHAVQVARVRASVLLIPDRRPA